MKKGFHKYIPAFACACVMFLGGCPDGPDRQGNVDIAVTSSYLACAVRDLCGDQMNVLCLVPPGMCPGHFDISPSQLVQLRTCKMLLLFDFQEQVEQKLSRLKQEGLDTALVKKAGGLCVPENYLETCRQVCGILSAKNPETAEQYRRRLELLKHRIESLKKELLERVRRAGLSSAGAVASNHQTDFLSWLGLDTIATFIGSDIETVAGIERCINKAQGHNVRFVVANEQEGTGLAKAMAERLGAEAVVFSNFPDNQAGPGGFDELLRANVKALLEAAGR